MCHILASFVVIGYLASFVVIGYLALLVADTDTSGQDWAPEFITDRFT